jgi:hypothetical protein
MSLFDSIGLQRTPGFASLFSTAAKNFLLSHQGEERLLHTFLNHCSKVVTHEVGHPLEAYETLAKKHQWKFDKILALGGDSLVALLQDNSVLKITVDIGPTAALGTRSFDARWLETGREVVNYKNYPLRLLWFRQDNHEVLNIDAKRRKAFTTAIHKMGFTVTDRDQHDSLPINSVGILNEQLRQSKRAPLIRLLDPFSVQEKGQKSFISFREEWRDKILFPLNAKDPRTYFSQQNLDDDDKLRKALIKNIISESFGEFASNIFKYIKNGENKLAESSTSFSQKKALYFLREIERLEDLSVIMLKKELLEHGFLK